MKSRLFFPIFFVLIVSSCSQGIPKPKPFLKQARMVELLTEMQLTEAMIQRLQSETRCTVSTRAHADVAYAHLFEKYGLTRESFEENLLYYTYHSRDLQKIYEQVQDNLVRLDSLRQF